MECRLVSVTSGVGSQFTLREGSTTLGRDSDNDIQIMSEGVSRHHAVFHNMPSTCELEDLDSTNGTFVNGGKISRSNLNHLDEIRIGEHILRFETVGTGGYGADMSNSRDYSDRAQFDTIKIKRREGEDVGAKSKTTSIDQILPIRPKQKS